MAVRSLRCRLLRSAVPRAPPGPCAPSWASPPGRPQGSPMTPCLSSPASSAARSVRRPAVPTTVAAPPPIAATAPSTKPSEQRGQSSSTLAASSAGARPTACAWHRPRSSTLRSRGTSDTPTRHARHRGHPSTSSATPEHRGGVVGSPLASLTYRSRSAPLFAQVRCGVHLPRCVPPGGTPGTGSRGRAPDPRPVEFVAGMHDLRFFGPGGSS